MRVHYVEPPAEPVPVYAEHWRRGTASSHHARLQQALACWRALQAHGRRVPLPALFVARGYILLVWRVPSANTLLIYRVRDRRWLASGSAMPPTPAPMDPLGQFLPRGLETSTWPYWHRGEMRPDAQGHWRFHARA